MAESVKYETSEYLQSPEDVASYIEAALEEDDPALLLLALRNVTDSKGGMAMIAKQTGVKPEDASN